MPPAQANPLPGLYFGVPSRLLIAKGSELLSPGWDSGVEFGDHAEYVYPVFPSVSPPPSWLKKAAGHHPSLVSLCSGHRLVVLPDEDKERLGPRVLLGAP